MTDKYHTSEKPETTLGDFQYYTTRFNRSLIVVGSKANSISIPI